MEHTNSISLKKLQNWMQTFIVSQENQEAALAIASKAIQVPTELSAKFILPSKTLSSTERLEIYRGMYFLRMRDALAIDYYALLHFLGDDKFDDLVKGYIKTFPSTNYNLNRLSDKLPGYIQSTLGIKRQKFLYDLARLELAVAQVFDCSESKIITNNEIKAVPENAWGKMRLQPVESLKLFEFRYPVNSYLQSVRDETPHPEILRQDTWLVVYRKNYSVWRLELKRPAYVLLQYLVLGTTLETAITFTMKRFAKYITTDQIFKWFNDWISAGIFQSISCTD